MLALDFTSSRVVLYNFLSCGILERRAAMDVLAAVNAIALWQDKPWDYVKAALTIC